MKSSTTSLMSATTGTHAHGWYAGTAFDTRNGYMPASWNATAIWGARSANPFTATWQATAVWGTCGREDAGATQRPDFHDVGVSHLIFDRDNRQDAPSCRISAYCS